MNFKNVTVAGSGVLGYQIAFQTAFHGFKVTVYDINDEVLDKAKAKFFELSECYKQEMNATQEQLDLAEAVKDADLMIEAVPEDPAIKRDFYEKLNKVAPEKTVFATNTSTLLPSQFKDVTGRPEKFLALHFANRIWVHNMAEIMGHETTDKKVFDDLVEFAKAIDMLPIPIYKEQPGYVLNSILVPYCISALELWVNNISDPETIDKTWMKAYTSPKGPFAILDMIGINTVYNVAKLNVDVNPAMARIVERLQAEGFYNYPNPAYESANFLK